MKSKKEIEIEAAVQGVEEETSPSNQWIFVVHPPSILLTSSPDHVLSKNISRILLLEGSGSFCMSMSFWSHPNDFLNFPGLVIHKGGE